MKSARRFKTISRALVEQVLEPFLLATGQIKENEYVVLENLALDLGMYIYPKRASKTEGMVLLRINGKQA